MPASVAVHCRVVSNRAPTFSSERVRSLRDPNSVRSTFHRVQASGTDRPRRSSPRRYPRSRVRADGTRRRTAAEIEARRKAKREGTGYWATPAARSHSGRPRAGPDHVRSNSRSQRAYERDKDWRSTRTGGMEVGGMNPTHHRGDRSPDHRRLGSGPRRRPKRRQEGSYWGHPPKVRRTRPRTAPMGRPLRSPLPSLGSETDQTDCSH